MRAFRGTCEELQTRPLEAARDLIGGALLGLTPQQRGIVIAGVIEGAGDDRAWARAPRALATLPVDAAQVERPGVEPLLADPCLQRHQRAAVIAPLDVASAIQSMAGQVVALEVKISWGRSLAIPAVAGGLACFHFNDLCRRPLAAEDFLCLATRFHTVFVHGVPRLSLEEHNEARRFTNLVDALYEHSVRLLCRRLGRAGVRSSGAARSARASAPSLSPPGGHGPALWSCPICCKSCA
ncbi:unnamed protein product [Prorocentrum cordatum]|uniref:Uncharacterized protein n=1 Tax=Prorocentrum cordatum TaxID=2364126 RepID=A0ABN9QDD5_9DINO|nr:unnamed protein product [Polarella glacialis]